MAYFLFPIEYVHFRLHTRFFRILKAPPVKTFATANNCSLLQTIQTTRIADYPLFHSTTSIPGYLTIFNLNFNSCRLPWFRGSFWWAYFFGNRKPRVHRAQPTSAEFKTRIHLKSDGYRIT